MTDIVPAGNGKPEGLEDFEVTDSVMPTLRIQHHESNFLNQLTNETYSDMDVILLGLVKQRVLWPAEIPDEGSKERPLCRSYNFMEGHPNADKFPYEASGFPDNSPGTLPCNSCKLKEWGTHPTRDAPWCSEQHTFAMLIPPTSDDGQFTPILFSIQRSGLKESRTYCSAFYNAKMPLFTVHTKMTLESRKRGSNPYCIPKFVRGETTNESDYPTFSAMLRSIREFLQTPWTGNDDEEEKSVASVGTTDSPDATTPSSAGSTLGSAPAPSAGSTVVDDEEELPF